jgi:phthalate 4,5-cis-dihydrodiol dehydrogenase
VGRIILHHVSPAAVKYGLIGPGSHAEEQLLPALSSLEGARLAGVAARRGEVAQKVAERWNAEYWTDSWAGLFEPSVVDAVVVAASPQLHEEVIAQAIERQIPLYVEKPPARTTQALEKLIASYDSADRKPPIFVGFNYPYGATYQQLRKKLVPYGPIRSLEVRLVSAKPVRPAWGSATILESLLQAIGTHAVHLVVSEFGKPDTVSARLLQYNETRCAVKITLAYDDGRSASVHIGNHSNRLDYSCEMITESGTVGKLDQFGTLTLTVVDGADHHPLLDSKEVIQYTWPSRRGGHALAGYSGSLMAFHSSVLDSPVPAISTLAASLDVFRVLDAVRNELGLPGA